jgi:hypothetical protein
MKGIRRYLELSYSRHSKLSLPDYSIAPIAYVSEDQLWIFRILATSTGGISQKFAPQDNSIFP